MKLTASREDLLAPLQSVIGVVERRQTMPVLANVLLSARDNRLSITGTDLEVELVATSNVTRAAGRGHHVPGRKLLDIFQGAAGENQRHAEHRRRAGLAARRAAAASRSPACRPRSFRWSTRSMRSRRSTVSQGEFRRLIDKTHFSMAQQDVRYYLNGMLLETEGKSPARGRH